MTISAMPVPTTLAVREATAADGPALAEFVRTTFTERVGQHLSPGEMGEFLGDYLNGTQDGRCFVASADGMLVGYAVAAPRHTRGSVLDRLYVSESEKSRAVAMALLLAVEAACEEPHRATDPLEIYDRWGFVDLPALRSCLASPWGFGTLPVPRSATSF